MLVRFSSFKSTGELSKVNVLSHVAQQALMERNFVSPAATSLLAFIPLLMILAVVFGICNVRLDLWLSTADTPSYIAVAHHMAEGERSPNAWHERVFPGWSLLLVPFSLLGVAAPGAVALAVLMATLVPWLAWKLTEDHRTALACAVLLPVWLLQVSLGMSEPSYLVAILLGLIALTLRQTAIGAFLVGFAALIRPTALFAWAGGALVLWRRRQWRKLVLWSVISAAVASLIVPINLKLYSEALRQTKLYSTLPNIGDAARRAGIGAGKFGHLGIPFKALVETPLLVNIPTWKIVYIWAHVLMILVSCWLALRRIGASELEGMLSVWALLNSAFIISAGPYWGFHSFDRYCLWAMPAYMFLLSRYLPQTRWAWYGIALLTTLTALSARWALISG
jgi:hypothetical protein